MAQESQTLKLPDGRILGFAEYGDTAGHPVLYFHGYPSSRLEGKGIAELAKRQNPQRRIIDWPEDVETLAAHLDINRFAILGGSGGGPYAVACAYSLPQSVLSSVVLLASAGPWESGKQGVPWPSYLLYLGVSYVPGPTRVLSDLTLGGLRWLAYTGPVIRWLDGWLRKVDEEAAKKTSTGPTVSDEELSIQQRRDQILNLGFESFTQGTAAFIQEAQLLSLPWGFRLEDVKYDKIEVWHGLQDWNVPIRQIRWMAERLPHCELHEVEGNHFEVASHLDEIFQKIEGRKVFDQIDGQKSSNS